MAAALSSLARTEVQREPPCCSEELFARLASRMRQDLNRGAAANARLAYVLLLGHDASTQTPFTALGQIFGEKAKGAPSGFLAGGEVRGFPKRFALTIRDCYDIVSTRNTEHTSCRPATTERPTRTTPPRRSTWSAALSRLACRRWWWCSASRPTQTRAPRRASSSWPR